MDSAQETALNVRIEELETRILVLERVSAAYPDPIELSRIARMALDYCQVLDRQMFIGKVAH